MKVNILFILAAFLGGGIFIVVSIPSLNYLTLSIGLVVIAVAFILLGRSMSRGRSRGEKLYVAVDLLSVALMGIFFLSMAVGNLSGLVTNDQPTQNVTHFMIELGLIGIVMAFVSKVLRLTSGVSKVQFSKELIYISANFGAFLILNIIVPPTAYRILGLSSVLPSNPFITVMISVPEELVFRLWLGPWLGNISRTGAIGGSFMQAIIGTAYHLFVLGTNPSALGIVFASFFVMGFTAMRSKLLSITITDHLVNNFLSVTTGI